MKQSGICPKCASMDILLIPGYAGAYGSGNYIPVPVLPLRLQRRVD